jgi:hypothetical protein
VHCGVDAVKDAGGKIYREGRLGWQKASVIPLIHFGSSKICRGVVVIGIAGLQTGCSPAAATIAGPKKAGGRSRGEG